MSAISNFLSFLRSAIYAIDVRDGIADAIEQCYSDVSNPTLRTEALEAALQNKIDQGEMAALTIGDGTITAAKLAQGVIDNTLATSGAAADAKKTGDEIAAVKADLDAVESEVSALEVISPDIKNALLDAFEHVMWFEGSSEYYDALVDALYASMPVIKVHRGIGTSGTDIVSNEKRMLSDPIPFTNEAPITIRAIGNNNGYGYRPKFINTQNNLVLDANLVGDNGGLITYRDSNNVSSRFISNSEEYTAKSGSPMVATKANSTLSGEVISGYMRLLFVNASDTNSELPTTQIPTYVIVQGIRYRLEEDASMPVIKVHRGIGTSGTDIVSNEKRMLSDPIPFTNEAPITIRAIGNNNGYGYRPKFINTQNNLVLDANLVGDNGGLITYRDSNNVSSRFISNSEEYTAKSGSPMVATKANSTLSGEVISGYMRLLFVNASDTNSELPTTQIPTYVIVQGVYYALEEDNS